MSEDETMDPVEQAQAEALAHALERGSGGEELPHDALEAAALLRYSVDGGELPRDREDAVLSDVLEGAEKIRARRPEPARRPWWAWVFGLTGAAAIGALVLFFVLRPSPPTPTPEVELPAPSADLLSLSLGRIEAPEQDAAFEVAMRDYRGRVYGALRERYEDR